MNFLDVFEKSLCFLLDLYLLGLFLYFFLDLLSLMLFDLVIELALKVILLLNLCLFLRRCQVSLLSQLFLNLVLSLAVSYDIL